MVTRAEHDDGAAYIDGQLVDIRQRNELRVRFLTPYNFIIAAHDSPINNQDFDARIVELLNALLGGEDKLACERGSAFTQAPLANLFTMKPERFLKST